MYIIKYSNLKDLNGVRLCSSVFLLWKYVKVKNYIAILCFLCLGYALFIYDRRI